MRYALVGLICFGAGWGCAHALAMQATIETLLRVPLYNYRNAGNRKGSP